MVVPETLSTASSRTALVTLSLNWVHTKQDWILWKQAQLCPSQFPRGSYHSCISRCCTNSDHHFTPSSSSSMSFRMERSWSSVSSLAFHIPLPEASIMRRTTLANACTTPDAHTVKRRVKKQRAPNIHHVNKQASGTRRASRSKTEVSGSFLHSRHASHEHDVGCRCCMMLMLLHDQSIHEHPCVYKHQHKRRWHSVI